MTFRVLDLFSGIGGFSMGLERTGGFKTVAFCEIEDFPRKVLAKHWPGVPIYDDVRTLTADRLRADGIAIDVVCGGFPCQDVSIAGNRAGLEGERSGLWCEMARLIGELRPRFVIVENTPGLLSLGMGTVLGDLAALGFDAEWHGIPAAAIGAEHIRDRIWIIAHPHDQRELQPEGPERKERRRTGNGAPADAADPDAARYAGRSNASANGENVGGFGARLRSLVLAAPPLSREHWNHKPVLGRGVHGVPHRLDRIAALGNAVVPQIPELIGYAILAQTGETAQQARREARERDPNGDAP